MKLPDALCKLIPSIQVNTSDEDVVRAVLEWIGISQAQLAALLAASPQAVSKGFREQGIRYLGEDGRPQSLYLALTQIGGDRYAHIANRLRDISDAFNWGSLTAPVEQLVSARDLYAMAQELWIVSDNPGATINWGALKAHISTTASINKDYETKKLIIFFMRSLEGADRWAEVLWREFAQGADIDGRIDTSRGKKSGAFLYIIVTNTLPFVQDHVIVNPGSISVEMASSTSGTSVYQWLGNSYAKVPSPNLEFIRVAHHFSLGGSPVKANFFPHGMLLDSTILEYKFSFFDSIIAVRGDRHVEGEKPEERPGDVGQMVGGVLRTRMAKTETALNFDFWSKFAPFFLLVFKRRAGDDGMNPRVKKAIRIFEDEIKSNRPDGGEPDTKIQPRKFL